MAANDTILSAIPVQNGLVGVKNTDGSNDLTAGMSVTLDTGNLLSTTQPSLGVKQATADDIPFGVTIGAIAKTKFGSVAVPFTAIVPAVASGAITAGTFVEADTGGKFKTQAAGKPAFGIALTTTANSGDQFLIGLCASKNA